ncbi:MAG: FIST C-terminal domain-containing protein [Deltaproteobacteria bacterium]|nr:FIST C-terminal domain-containing protein [Deltaproteobacteria bacterium]
MTTQAGVGRSLASSPFTAGSEAASEAMEALDGAADLVLVFGTAAYDAVQLLEGVRSVVGDARISGCSGEGIIAGSDSHEVSRAVAVMAFRSNRMRFESFVLGGYGDDPAGCAASLARAVAEFDDGRVLIVLPDGLVGDCTAFLDALDRAAPDNLTIVGGTAGDEFQFEKTYQYDGTEAVTGAVAAVLIRGDVHAEVAVSHGCVPIGMERIITKSEGGWVHELDGRPAWEVFKEYLDGNPEDLTAEGIVHLCIGERLDDDRASNYDTHIIRTPMQLDQESGALFFPGGGLLEGNRIQLTRRDEQKIRDSAEACARSILKRGAERRPDLVLQFDCSGRGRILFGPCAGEAIVEPLRNTLGPDVPWIGFHTYGEIAQIKGKSYYHNYTVALCALYEQ